MKILFLTNFYPKVDNKNSGIFVVKRLFEYKNLGIDFDVIPIYMKDDVILSLARKILKLSSTEAIEEFYNINFKIVNVKINLFKKILEKIGVVNFSKEFFKYLEKELDLNSYDIVYAHGMSLNIPAGFIAKIIFEKYKIPYIVTLHGGDVNYNMAKFGKKTCTYRRLKKLQR